MRRCLIVVVLLVASACSGNNNASTSPIAPTAPSAPQISMGTLHIAVDVSTCWALGPVSVSVDGVFVGSIEAGSAGLSIEEPLGPHTISGVANVIDLALHTTWFPNTVTVPAAGFNYTMYCTSNHGYSVAR